MNVIQRAQAILLKPREEWPVIDAEPATVASLYSGYIVILAAIPAIAGFIGLSLIGAGAFGFSFKIPIVTGLVRMVTGYLLSLVSTFIGALVVDALAPSFGGVKNQVAALKVVAFSSTAYWVAGVLQILPSLGIIGVLLGLYSIYLLYLGLPVVMKCPAEKAAGYTAVTFVCMLVIGIVMGAIIAVLAPTGAMGLGGLGAHAAAGDGEGKFTLKTPDGQVTFDTEGMKAAAARMDAARARMDAAQAASDPAAAGKALGEMMGAMAGNGGGAPIPASDLKGMLPESLGDMKRESFEANGGAAMGIATSTATATYASGDKRVHLAITDLGGMSGLAAMAGWANMTQDRETQDEVEKVYKDGNRTIHEEYRKDGSHAEYSVVLSNGVIVEAKGDGVDAGTVKAAAGGIDLGRIESMKRAQKA
ncbi:MAG: Yip1 family protein [Burkholderiaceae bacterium]